LAVREIQIQKRAGATDVNANRTFGELTRVLRRDKITVLESLVATTLPQMDRSPVRLAGCLADAATF
jgi:hypothetical protein